MTTFFKTVICPRCKEDYLLVTLDKATDKLYLSCSECEASWSHPDDVENTEKMFVDLDIDAADPNANDLNRFNWMKYVSGTFEN
jgi:transcription elongation factor Elf1